MDKQTAFETKLDGYLVLSEAVEQLKADITALREAEPKEKTDEAPPVQQQAISEDDIASFLSKLEGLETLQQ